ncbi:MAG: hypothetical protein ABL870_09840 [Sediminibacterium sp.]
MNISQAKDDILTLFKAYWDAQLLALYPTLSVQLIWPGVDIQTPPLPETPFLRVSIFHNFSRQATFAPGAKRYERSGLVTIQIFTPLSSNLVAPNIALCEKLGIITRDAFEGKNTPGGVWFRNANLREVGSDGTWYQFNMSVEFNYDEFK